MKFEKSWLNGKIQSKRNTVPSFRFSHDDVPYFSKARYALGSKPACGAAKAPVFTWAKEACGKKVVWDSPQVCLVSCLEYRYYT